MEHLTAHFWLTDDGATLCKPCGARYKASASEVVAFSMTGIRLFMEKHRACGQAAQAPQKVQIKNGDYRTRVAISKLMDEATDAIVMDDATYEHARKLLVPEGR